MLLLLLKSILDYKISEVEIKSINQNVERNQIRTLFRVDFMKRRVKIIIWVLILGKLG